MVSSVAHRAAFAQGKCIVRVVCGIPLDSEVPMEHQRAPSDMQPIDDRLRQEITAWLEFYRELGIESFYLRPPGAGVEIGNSKFETRKSKIEHQDSAVNVDASSAALSTTANAGFPTAGSESRSPSSELGTPNSPSRFVISPAQALNLFETPSEPAARRERETLEQIREDLGDCQRCKLAAGRKHIVFGQGNPHAELVFVGEGPGADEDEQGLPFVGRAGKLLNKMLQLVGIRREDVYICNVVKCRPPGNRTPEHDEVEACSPFLYRQIAAIQPRLVCCLGAPAVRTVLGLKEGMLKLRGRFYDFGGAKAIATVHPAYVLRNPREEKILREDFEKIRDFLRNA